MSINVNFDTAKIQSETVATGLIITRNVNQDASVFYTATLQAGTHSFIVDENNVPVKVLVLNQNSISIGLSPEEAGIFFMTPLKNMDGTDTCLGIILARLMDDKIQAVVQSNQPPTPDPIPDPIPPVVFISGNTGVAGVTLSYDNNIIISDENGNYAITVNSNWSGTIIPTLENYTFTPENYSYSNIVENQIDQNYNVI